jgi:phosphoserine phosphatase RsbU/P
MAVLKENRRNHSFTLTGKLTVIGRNPSCDIVVESPMVSSQHALILHTADGYTIDDLGSMNGTFVNGRRLTARRTLASGDRIDLFGLSLTFEPGEEAVAENQVSTRRPPLKNIPSQQKTVPSTPPGGTHAATIGVSELLAAHPVQELSTLEIDGDLRLSVKPEAKLRAVLEISRILSDSLELKIVLPRILDSLFSIFPQADCGFVLLRNQQTGEFVPSAVKFRREHCTGALPISRGIIQQTLLSGRAILSADAGADSRFNLHESIRHLEIRSIMCVPMHREGGVCMGVIQLHSQDRSHQFKQEDLDLLVCASLLAGRALEVAKLHEERRELEAATQIQRSLLPSERPSFPGLRFFDYYAPAQHVSGDYFDYISLPGNRLALAVGDVAGKGIAAALLMAHLAAAARVCLATASSPAEAVRELNLMLIRSGCDDRFVTFAVAILDLDQFRLTIVNAGHLPPLLRRSATGDVVDLAGDLSGLPLGVADRPYQQVEVPLEPGETLLLYTDGVTEMRNPKGELYGVDRVRAAVQGASADAECVGNFLLTDVTEFAEKRLPGDDLTILCVGRESASAV